MNESDIEDQRQTRYVSHPDINGLNSLIPIFERRAEEEIDKYYRNREHMGIRIAQRTVEIIESLDLEPGNDISVPIETTQLNKNQIIILGLARELLQYGQVFVDGPMYLLTSTE